jgi:multiple sugar transport system permease protein
MIPNFLILTGFGWLDIYQGMIIPSMISATYNFIVRRLPPQKRQV